MPMEDYSSVQLDVWAFKKDKEPPEEEGGMTPFSRTETAAEERRNRKRRGCTPF